MAGIQVSYKSEGEKHIIDTGNKAIGDIVINTEGIAPEERNGTALEIVLDVTVEIDDDDYDTFERIKKVMRNGCLVTSSLHDGIEMKYNLDATTDED